MVSKLRAQRIADRIFEELAILLLREVADPRLTTVSITDVRVDRELAFANIYVSSIEGSEAASEILDGLRHAGGFLRSELSHRIDLRYFPRLRFYWDPNPEKADHIDKLLASISDDDAPTSSDPPKEDEPGLNG